MNLILEIRISILLLLLTSVAAYGGEHSAYADASALKNDTILIHFRFDRVDIDSSYMSNASALADVDRILSSNEKLQNVDSIVIKTMTSPEGAEQYNINLSERRANAVQKFIVERYPYVVQKLRIGFAGEGWQMLRDSVLADPIVPSKDRVLEIIDTDIKLDAKESLLKQLDGGNAWNYLKQNILPHIRTGVVTTLYLSNSRASAVGGNVHNHVQESKEQDVATIIPGDVSSTSSTNKTNAATNYSCKPFLAVKTNLLFDALLVPNIEVEIPIKDRWSIAGEWMFPWWVTKDNGNALQILSGNIEGRYWLGDRARRDIMTGWFAGLYAGGGYYDLQYNDNGYQGEFFIAAGLAAGYAHTINKCRNLRMEYMLGVGYLETNYRYYEGRENNEFLVWQHDGAYTWIGPTKIEVSLVWLWNKKVKGGER